MSATIDFSIVIPVYNGEKYIDQSIEAALAQTYKAAEIIVVDDCSTDGSVKRAEAWGDSVKVIRRTINSGGCGVPRNDGIEAAKSNYIVPFDVDDVMYPQKLARNREILLVQPDLQVVTSDSLFSYVDACRPDQIQCQRRTYFRKYLKLVGKELYRLEHSNVLDSFMHENFSHPNALVFSKQAWQRVGGYENILCEDIGFFLRLAEIYDFGFVDEVLQQYVIRSSGLMSNNMIKGYLKTNEALERYLVFPMAASSHRALCIQMSDLEVDLLALCTDARLFRDALVHLWRSFKLAGFRRLMLRPVMNLFLKLLGL